MPYFSIIIPVYNAESTISRCVDSILSQSFSDFELLLIDDGSTDKSAEICDRYESSDSRVRTVHKKNSGPSRARNTGIELSTGEYLLFVDSDDYVEKEYIERFNDNKSDLTVCGTKNVNELGVVLSVVKHSEENHFDKEPDYSALFRRGVVFSPWGKLFIRDIIVNNKITFPTDISWGEDGIFVCNYIKYIHSFKYIDYLGYNYVRYQAQNTLSSKIRDDLIDDIIAHRTECIDILKRLPEKEFLIISNYINEDIRKNCSYVIIRIVESNTLSDNEKVRLLSKMITYSFVKETVERSDEFYPEKWRCALKQNNAEKIVGKYNRISKKKSLKKRIKSFKRKLKSFLKR